MSINRAILKRMILREKLKITWNPSKYTFYRFRTFCIFFSFKKKNPAPSRLLRTCPQLLGFFTPSVRYSELSQKNRFSLCNKFRHCAYIINKVKTWFKKKCILPEPKVVHMICCCCCFLSYSGGLPHPPPSLWFDHLENHLLFFCVTFLAMVIMYETRRDDVHTTYYIHIYVNHIFSWAI